MKTEQRWLNRPDGRFDITGAYDVEVPPVPIPNTEVKLNSAENTWREAAWEDRSVPVLFWWMLPFRVRPPFIIYNAFWRALRLDLREQLKEQLHKTLDLLEALCPFDELHGEGICGVVYRRYQNAFSVFHYVGASYEERRKSLQFLISANRAYVGNSGVWDDAIRKELLETDRLIDHYLNRE